MRRRAPLSVLSLLLLLSATARAPLAATGARAGSLILSGAAGGSRESFGAGVLERFVELAGGPDAEFVYIPTASSGIRLDDGFIYEPPDTDTPAPNTEEFERKLATMFGVRRIHILHTRSRMTANSESFVATLRRAGGVWIIGGNSAGAIIQGSFIVRGRPDKPVLMARGHERGFGFLKKVVVNPHLTTAKREDELINVVDAHPELLGIGIDEKGAILVRGDEFQVLGESKVAVYDDKRHGGKWYYWLSPGAVFSLRTRTVAPARGAP